MKVRALNTYEKYRIEDKELKRIVKEGEEFEVTEERYEVLKGNNEYKLVFVKKIEEVETAIKKDKTKKAANKAK